MNRTIRYMSVRSFASVMAVLAAAATSVVVSSGPAEATSPIQLGKIQYDSPGSDTRTNASINAEYVVVRNTGTRTATLAGWTVRDAQNHVYTFRSFSLGAGKTVVLRSGKGTNSATTRFWGSASYIWNNTGDRANLRNAAGAAIDSCVWTTAAPGYKNC